MDKRVSSPIREDVAQPLKIRRIARACLQCRTRKQRCLPSSDNAGLQAPCKRCQQHIITCSFETDPISGPDVSPSPSQMAQIVVDLQRRINRHEARIGELERHATSLQSNQQKSRRERARCSVNAVADSISPISHIQANFIGPNDGQPPHVSQTNIPTAQSPRFNMNSIDLEAPIATLRSLGALSKDSPSPGFQILDPKGKANFNKLENTYDPVAIGILSVHEAQKLINIFFDHCHPLAPVLNERLRYSSLDMRVSSPTLFLAICSVGARFWVDDGAEPDSAQGLHPRFFELIALVDKAVSQLLLRPTPFDVTLDSIRLLLLYAQWMPLSRDGEYGSLVRSNDSRGPAKSRYSDISAWAVLGLAIRYAQFIGLDQATIAPFQGPAKSISEDDVSRLRVWHNLITCDCNLMLASGLPTSFDPTPAASIARAFGSHRTAQQPEDLRITALVELAVIAHRATRTCGDFPGRQPDALCLRKASTEMDEWERSWVVRLKHTESQHNQLPFNSVRWYRLALHSASLGPLFSNANRSQRPPIQVRLLQSLEICLTAASQMLLSLSSYGADYVWSLESQNTATFPEGPFSVDPAALKRLFYAVDSTWVSHTFAVTFLVLGYVKGIVDSDLQVCSLTPGYLLQTSPLFPNEESVISRLVRLAMDVFDGICQTATFHPARDFRAIVHHASSLIIPPNAAQVHTGQDVDTSAMQSLLDFMNDSGLDRPGNIFDSNTDFSASWEEDEMIGL